MVGVYGLTVKKVILMNRDTSVSIEVYDIVQVATEGRDGLSFGYLFSKFSKVIHFAPYKRT